MQALKINYAFIPWALVAASLIGMVVIIYALRQSNFFLLYHNDTLRMVSLNGQMPKKNFNVGPVFMPHMQKQLQKIDTNHLLFKQPLCLQHFSRPDSVIAIINRLRTIITITKLQYVANEKKEHSTAKVILTIHAHNPFNIVYHFSQKTQADMVLDSICGVDSLLLYFNKMPHHKKI